MKLQRMILILNTIALLNAIGQGERAYRLGVIAEFSTLPRSTCDRYLKRMTKLGLLDVEVNSYRCENCRNWSITEQGKQLLDGAK